MEKILAFSGSIHQTQVRMIILWVRNRVLEEQE
jgi:hypothetical protein